MSVDNAVANIRGIRTGIKVKMLEAQKQSMKTYKSFMNGFIAIGIDLLHLALIRGIFTSCWSCVMTLYRWSSMFGRGNCNPIHLSHHHHHHHRRHLASLRWSIIFSNVDDYEYLHLVGNWKYYLYLFGDTVFIILIQDKGGEKRKRGFSKLLRGSRRYFKEVKFRIEVEIFLAI